MSDDTLQDTDQNLIDQKPRTIKEFSDEATALAARRSKSTALKKHLEDWQAHGCRLEELRQNIQSILVFQRDTLAKGHLRCDGSIEQLRRTLTEIENGTVQRYFEDVIIAKELVEWCNEYTSFTPEQLTT